MLTWGDSLPIIDPSTSLSILLQNPNGLSLTSNHFGLLQDIQTCQEYGVTVVNLPETNTNWNSPDQHLHLQNTL
jgi:hypothetical protein